MRRREFIAAIGSAAAAWPLPARAQQGERVRHVGVLSYGEDVAAGYPSIQKTLRDDLAKLGWSEGRNLRLDLVINLKTAKALGLVVPPVLLARADEVIE